MSTNPFAPPQPERVPTRTERSLGGMRSSFEVAGVGVEVETAHWSGLEVYRVAGQEVARERNLGWHSRRVLQVRNHTVEIVGRWYPFLPVQVRIDGDQAIDDLFPQLGPVKIALAALVLPIGATLGWSILWDLWHLWSA